MTNTANPGDGGTQTQLTAEMKLEMIGKQITDLASMLRAQRDLLAQRNLIIPAEPVDTLQGLTGSLNRIERDLTSDDIELQQLRELARTTEVINSTLDLDVVLNDVIDTVIQLTGAERGYVVLKDDRTGQLEFRVARNLQQEDIEDEDFIVSHTVVQQVADGGEPIVTTNAEDDPRFSTSESIAHYMLRSILCVPLKNKGTVTGVIYADNRIRPDVFSEREQRLVYAFANQAAVAIENARLYEHLQASLARVTAMKDFMDNVFASIASGVIATDDNDLVTTINQAAAHILGISADDSVGRSLWDILPELYMGFKELYQDMRDSARPRVIEVEPVIERRGQVNLSLRLSPLKDQADVTQGVTLVLDDLTELKQRQAQLGAVRRYLPTALVDNIRTIDELDLGGVEREISVLVCDVRGFTTFSEQLPPESLITVINRYLGVSSESIDQQQGIIDKYLGDAVVGLFNTQLNPQVDHALRAVRAGLLMLERVRSLHEQLPPEQRLVYGIGIHTGYAILGNIGSPRRKEFTVIGDTLQYAKALQENAVGEVVISEATYGLVNEYFHCTPIQQRRASEQPLTLYSVIGAKR